jgi:N-acetylneuraminic acid mutarotase
VRVIRPLIAAFLAIAAVVPACGTSANDAAAHPAAAGTWAAAPPLPVARFEAYAAVANGRVYFLGGITGVLGDIRTAKPSRRVDVFDPATQRWTDGPELPADAPKHHLAVAVANDAVYVVGGFDGILGQGPNEPFRPIAVAYVLDAGASAWRKLAPPPLARGAATAQAIRERIYVTGGAPNEGEPSYAQLDIYDIEHDTWSVGSSLPTPREHLASCAVAGTMLVVGGWKDAPKVAQMVAERYDPVTDRWSPLPPMTTPRGGLAATTVGSTCHVVGGEDWALPPPGTFSMHETFDATTNAWTSAAPMPTSRHGLGLASIAGALYAVGGGPSQGNSYTATVEAFRP